MRKTLLVAGCLGLVGALAGCTGSPPARPTPTVPPIVGDPLDMTRAATRPCTLLRPDQLAQYHVTTPGTPTSIAGGPACSWTPTPARLPSFRAGVDTHSGGLTALYRERNSLPVFRPATISEYPAVHTAATADALRRGRCTVEVGVAGDTLLIVDVTVADSGSLDYTDPCSDADAVAADVIAGSEAGAP